MLLSIFWALGANLITQCPTDGATGKYHRLGLYLNSVWQRSTGKYHVFERTAMNGDHSLVMVIWKYETIDLDLVGQRPLSRSEINFKNCNRVTDNGPKWQATRLEEVIVKEVLTVSTEHYFPMPQSCSTGMPENL